MIWTQPLYALEEVIDMNDWSIGLLLSLLISLPFIVWLIKKVILQDEQAPNIDRPTIPFDVFIKCYNVNPKKWTLYDMSVMYNFYDDESGYVRCYTYYFTPQDLKRYLKWRHKNELKKLQEAVNKDMKEGNVNENNSKS
jgi:hypothetical protein